jgi:LmbE family N-acetylglucosaminyl deacetylase
MIKPMNILAIGAHPDDVEYGCAGTLLKYAERKHRIFLMILTRGEHGRNGPGSRQKQIGETRRNRSPRRVSCEWRRSSGAAIGTPVFPWEEH